MSNRFTRNRGAFMKIGLALGSGAAKGIAHIGVLKALEELGIEVSYIAGSSMGAFVGAAYAAGNSAQELEKVALESTWKRTTRMFAPTISRAGLVSGKQITSFLEDVIGASSFDQLGIPLAVETTDIESGELNTILEGDLIQAVRASISLPLILTPVEFEGRILVDGGLVSPVPIQTVRDMGADFVIAVRLSRGTKNGIPRTRNEEEDRSRVRAVLDQQKKALRYIHGVIFPDSQTKSSERTVNVLQTLANTSAIAQHKIASDQIQREKPDLLIEPEVGDIGAFDFHKGSDVINGTCKATKILLAKHFS